MKNGFAALVLSLFLVTGFAQVSFAGDDECPEKNRLAEGACLEPRSLVVTLANGDEYPICRYETDSELLATFVCPADEPYPYVTARELGFWSKKKGVAIDEDKQVSVVRCRSELVYEKVGCMRSPY
jgi:hypothetical protein